MIEILPPGDQWDQTLIVDLLKQTDHDNVYVLIIPGRYWYDKTDQINKKISQHNNVLILVTSDEEALLDTTLLQHDNMKIWLQSPHMNNPRKADRYFPIGYSPHTRDNTSKPTKLLKYFFAGQNTHSRRKECIKNLKLIKGGIVEETKSFNSGLPQDLYHTHLRNAIVAPCPSGAVIPDTFRLYEALEAGCVPIVDGLDPKGESKRYFNFLFDIDELPFPTLENWEDLEGTIDYFRDTYPHGNNRAFAWWQREKRFYKQALKSDIGRLRESYEENWFTVLVPTSPIGSHPDTSIIEETLNSIRKQTDAEIIIMIDGLRNEQKHYKKQYDEYINRLLWLTHNMENVFPLLFDEHTHQAEMTKEALKFVDTKAILFVEHDTPLTFDYEIPLAKMADLVIKGDYWVIRLLHEAGIIPDHKHLMLDTNPIDVEGIPLLRTAQWSQRPHMASKSFYEFLLDEIPPGKKTMIEDAVHGITQEKYLHLGLPGWNQHRIAIYAPEGNMKRSYHLDGRGDDPKWT